MGSLPSLAGLSLREYGRSAFSTGAPGAVGQEGESPLLVWSVDMHRILFRYFPAIESGVIRTDPRGRRRAVRPDDVSEQAWWWWTVDDTENGLQLVDASNAGGDEGEESEEEADAGPGTKRTRGRAQPPPSDATSSSSGDVNLTREHGAYVQWLRLCRVPAVPRPRNGGVKSITESDIDLGKEGYIRHTFADVLKHANRALRDSLNMGENRVDGAMINQRVRIVNNASADNIAGVHINTLNADGRRVREEAYVKWVRSYQTGDGYTGNRLDDVDESIQVDHVVPKSWLRLTSNFDEFASCENDPSNVVLTRRTFNEGKHNKAIYFGDTGFLEKNTSHEWAPQGFVNKPAIARAIAFMFLTYPCVTSYPEALVGDGSIPLIGSPLYTRQLGALLRHLEEPPTEEELVRAYVNFGYYGWLNPLVVSGTVRTSIAQRKSVFYHLLAMRMAGTDMGSRKALAVFDDQVQL
jgi:hypothetical protein